MHVLVDCEWNDWQSWSDCSGTLHCGSGTKTKTRTKSVIENSSGACLGHTSETEFCDQGECPGELLSPLNNISIKSFLIIRAFKTQPNISLVNVANVAVSHVY